jgi:heat shock protein HslJ
MKAQRPLLLLVPFILALSGCMSWFGNDEAAESATAANPEHNARNSLDWAGSYRGVLPCADCEGIETVVVLRMDGTYDEFSRYLGEPNQIVFSESGTFTWNDAGNTVTFEGEDGSRYFVGEGQLIRLALDGSRITGALEQNYVLAMIPNTITERRWQLVELNGQPVEGLEMAPFLTLSVEGNAVSGYGGCNNFAGTFTLDEAASRIRFNNLVSTMRACIAGMEQESALHEVLNNVDNYSLNGSQLSLNRARMAPLARFEAVYLY